MARNPSFPQSVKPFDVIVIGGGINGAGIACEAASRGLSVGLYEAKDFAVATSSASSKLIHGGLRYLEQYEFRLVKEALAEREVLLNKAAHLVKPMRFRLPHHAALRPKWLIKAGLFLYDHLARRSVLQPSKTIQLKTSDGLKPQLTTAFEYSDCWVDDARLVISNIKQAFFDGAEVRNYCEVLNVSRQDAVWKVELHDQRTNTQVTRYARAVVNATGPWASDFLEQRSGEKSAHKMQLIKGSHLIVNQLYQGDEAYILQNSDKRVVFVIPYLDRFSMIGTTDIPYQGDPYKAKASQDEIDYLLDVCNQHFTAQLTQSDIIDSFSGVRPLFGDPNVLAQQQSRDYELVLSCQHTLPILTVYGGKLTTYRKLAQRAIDQLAPYFGSLQPSISANQVFTEANGLDSQQLHHQLSEQYPFLSQTCLSRLIHAYGVESWRVLEHLRADEAPIAAEVYQCELDYLQQQEWAWTGEDILYRRSKLCYQLTPQEQKLIEQSLS
ncbi:glycerol-3-phosphate dehydrogenase [Vibrio panuliri]|uniref:Glycerol-3-phosphate dehydrogenase n=1 Tax=Vibrio panuliri TaxID=1381081 RepID=A0A1Q9HA20_9VIBR|nr:glycerol-3-phosphate dehydrogenase [Vibrio panuliri]OLQ85894.1 glycerol-3-phosphate dehydrogenase [Vibrio panuliri]